MLFFNGQDLFVCLSFVATLTYVHLTTMGWKKIEFEINFNMCFTTKNLQMKVEKRIKNNKKY